MGEQNDGSRNMEKLGGMPRMWNGSQGASHGEKKGCDKDRLKVKGGLEYKDRKSEIDGWWIDKEERHLGKRGIMLSWEPWRVVLGIEV